VNYQDKKVGPVFDLVNKGQIMSDQNCGLTHLTQYRLRSPRAAAIAGIIFAVLTSVSMVLVQVSIPTDPTDISGVWLEQNADTVSIAIGLVPFAGIAFLWFMGVARDLLGHLEDQFFSTVFTGSGLLFLAMIFVWAAVGGALMAGYGTTPDTFIESGLYVSGRTLMRNIFNVYAMRLAGVYVFSTGSIWFRTGAVPRWLIILTWLVAVGLWLGVGFSWWVQLIFPAWVFLVSVYILRASLRDQPANQYQG
jgi:hypothetical protein